MRTNFSGKKQQCLQITKWNTNCLWVYECVWVYVCACVFMILFLTTTSTCPTKNTLKFIPFLTVNNYTQKHTYAYMLQQRQQKQKQLFNVCFLVFCSAAAMFMVWEEDETKKRVQKGQQQL